MVAILLRLRERGYSILESNIRRVCERQKKGIREAVVKGHLGPPTGGEAKMTRCDVATLCDVDGGTR